VTCGQDGILPFDQPATPCLVTYSCGGGACARAEQPLTGGSGSAEIIVQGLASNDVFTFTPAAARPEYVEIRLEFPTGEGDDTIILEDGVDLRNVTAGG
jgi:hypothetical protein